MAVVQRERLAAKAKKATTKWSRNADRIDGYDRDDLGLSVDY